MLKPSLFNLLNKPISRRKVHTIHINGNRLGFFRSTSYSQQTLTIYGVITNSNFPFNKTFELYFNTQEGTYRVDNGNYPYPKGIRVLRTIYKHDT
jgi:hypothetical protein